MKDLIRRFFSRDTMNYTKLSEESGSSASQEYLLATESLEKEASLSIEETETYDLPALSRPGEAIKLLDLPDFLIERISNLLDEVSLLSLKNINASFRGLIRIDDGRISQCARWAMLCLLEDDLLRAGKPLPLRLACRYCKRAHLKMDFGVKHGNAGHGIECLGPVETFRPRARFCWRSIPRMLDYTSKATEAANESRGRRVKDGWALVRRPTCCHCYTPLVPDQDDLLECPICNKECEVCKYLPAPIFERDGARRPLESHENIRFVRRACKHYKLEIQDLNGIRHPGRPAPEEPKKWRFGSFRVEGRYGVDVERCLLHSQRRRKNPFSLHGPVEIPQSPEAPGARRESEELYFHPSRPQPSLVRSLN